MNNSIQFKKPFFYLLNLCFLVSCSEKANLTMANQKIIENIKQDLEYFQFSPDSIPSPKFEGIELEYCYLLDSLKIATGIL